MKKIKVIGLFLVLISFVNISIAKTDVNDKVKSDSSICIPINKLSSSNNPGYIFKDVKNCLDNEKFSDAAKLYILGLSYGYFDTKRVSDKSAHQVVMILARNSFRGQSKENQKKVKTALKEVIKNNASICRSLSELGAPSYKPTYMIAHGMGAFTGSSTEDGLVSDFNKDATWKEVLTAFAKCTEK